MTPLRIVSAVGAFAVAVGLFLAQRGGREPRRSTLMGLGAVNLVMAVLMVTSLVLNTT